jgi:acyl carrier protein
METVAQKTKRVLADALGIDQRILTYDTHLQTDLGADSLDILEAIVLLENEFGVSVPDKKIKSMKRVGDLIKYFEDKKLIPIYSKTFMAA